MKPRLGQMRTTTINRVLYQVKMPQMKRQTIKLVRTSLKNKEPVRARLRILKQTLSQSKTRRLKRELHHLRDSMLSKDHNHLLGKHQQMIIKLKRMQLSQQTIDQRRQRITLM
jgi:hypothetical protein